MAWAIQQQHTHLNDDQAFAAADRVLEHFHFFQDMPRLIVGPS
jgi:hypothetical protein